MPHFRNAPLVNLKLALVATFALVSTAHGQAPRITSLSPMAVAPGQSTEVTLIGTDLAAPTGVWNTFGPAFAVKLSGKDKNGTAKDRVAYDITAPKDATVGVRAIRVATAGGVSNVRPILIDDLPTLAMAANTKPEQAQELPLPVAVEGTCTQEAFHYFKFRGEAGQRIAIDVWARRLGSALDSVVRVLDSQGRDIGYSDDDDAAEADSRVSVVLPAAGEYLIELRDIRYQGGPQHRFRMRVGDLPLVSTPYPLAIPRGATTNVTLLGAASEPTCSAEVAVPADYKAKTMTIAAKATGGKSSTPVTIAVSDRVEQLELEPNDTLETGSPIDLNGAINGRFNLPGDRDYYRFEAKKGDRWLFDGKTRCYGVPSDLLLRIYDSTGKQVAEADDSGLDEGSLDFACAADGKYLLMVDELLGRGGANHVYRIEINKFEPGFTLSLEVDTKAQVTPEPFNAPRGGAFVTKVAANRRGYTGPINLSIEGAGEGLKYTNNIIAEGKNDALLTVVVPESLESGKFFPVSVVGKATIDKKETTVVANTLAHLRPQMNGLNTPPAGLDGVAILGIGAPSPEFFKLELAAPAVIPITTTSTALKVKVTKLNKFDDKITLKLEGAPTGFTAKDAAIDKGKAEATIEITAPASALEGTIPLRIVATATHLNQPKSIVLEAPLKLVRPLAISATLARQGPAYVVQVKAERAAGVTGEIKIALANLPKGVKAADVVIAADKQEATVPLKVEGKLPRAMLPILVRGTIALKERSYRADSEPLGLGTLAKN